MRRRLFRAPTFVNPLRTRLHLTGLEDRTTPTTFTVKNALDSGADSLRDCLAQAAANPGADDITYDFAQLGQPITLTSPLNITDTDGVTVNPGGIRAVLSGGGATQVLTVAAGAKATFQLFIFNEGKGGDGGAISNAGTLTLEKSSVTNNKASGNGGGISNSGTLTLTETEVSKNTADGNGGGVANAKNGALVLNRSTVGAVLDGGTEVTGNAAKAGGGVFNADGGTTTLINSTLDKNTATTGGAGLENAGTAKLTNSTVANNTGAGLNTATGGATTSNNSLYVGNTGGEITGANLAASKNNLLGTTTAAGGLTNGTDGNIVGVADPTKVLGTLDQEGGVSSYPLADSSPAIDKGSNALAVDAGGTALAKDQANLGRVLPAAGTVDIGSREFVVTPPFGYGADGQTLQTEKNVAVMLTGLFITTTYTTPTVVTLTVNDGKLSFGNPLPGGVSNVSGDGTGTLTFTADKGALAGGAGAGLTFTPTTDAVYDAAGGKKLTIGLANGTNPTVTFSNPLLVTSGQPPAAAPSAPQPFNTATQAGLVRPLIIGLTQGAVNTNKLIIDGITGGKLFTDDKLTVGVTNGGSVDCTDARGFPFSYLYLYFQPTAGFTGAASFTMKAADINGTAFSPVVTDKIQVVAADIPFVAGDLAGNYSPIGPRQAGTSSYDFVVYYQDDKSVLANKLGDGDVTVTGRQGTFTQAAKFLGAAVNGKFTTATYRITAPGGTFNAAANGSYVVSLAAGKATDADGNSAPAQDLFVIFADQTAPAATIPTAKATTPAVDATYAGKTDYTFTITYADDKAVDVATVQGKNDLVSVIGPGGFVGAAEFVSVDQPTNGTPRVATYKLTAPGGDWDAADNGTYTVNLGYGAADTDANIVPFGYLGTFTASGLPAAAVPPVASFTVAGTTESEGRTTPVTVTVTLDKPAPDNLFVQVGFSGTATLNDPAVGNKVFDYTVTGFNLAPYTVQIAKGATTGTASLVIFDDTLVEPTETAILTIDPASAGITVGKQNTFTLSILDNDGPNADTAPPTAKFGAATAGTGGVYTVTVAYADNTAVAGASLDSSDIRVTGPGGFNQLATFVSATPTGNGPAVAATYKVTVPTAATATYTVALEANQVLDTAGNKAAAVASLGTFTFTAANTGPRATLVGSKEYAVGSDRGGDSSVRFYNPDNTSRLIDPLKPFGDVAGGVRTAAADFNGDGVADIVIGTGPGRATSVTVIDGATLAALFTVDPFEASFTGGVFVAAGDVNADGKAELVVTPDEGGGPVVAVYDSAGTQLARYFGIEDPNFRGGARAAVGDMDGDGKADILVAAGFGGGPRIAAFSGAGLSATAAPPKLFPDFFAFEDTLRNGTFVAVGDIDGDGKAEIIAGGGPGGGPRVSTFSVADIAAGNTTNRLADFFAGDPNSRGGVRLAVKNLDGDTKADLVTGTGTGAGSKVTTYTGKALAANSRGPDALASFDAVAGFTGGVFVG